MCDDISHRVLAAENSRLQEENDRLNEMLKRPVYVTVTPPVATPAPYAPVDPNMTLIVTHLTSISASLATIASKTK